MIHIGKGKPEKNITEALKELNVAYDRKIDRGSKFKFMWLDADQEADYAKAFEFDNKDKIVVLNPGKRKRYFEHPGDLTFDSIK